MQHAAPTKPSFPSKPCPRRLLSRGAEGRERLKPTRDRSLAFELHGTSLFYSIERFLPVPDSLLGLTTSSILDARSWMLDSGFWILVARCSTLDIGGVSQSEIRKPKTENRKPKTQISQQPS